MDCFLERKDRKLVFEDGKEVAGCGFGSRGDRVCEIVFNTSPVGYQEILSDPSYTDQAVVMTYPLIGNTGIAEDDYETRTPTAGALIVRDYNDLPSNFRSVETLDSVMVRFGIPGISGVDTRMLTRSIRDHGSRKVLLTDLSTPAEKAVSILRNTELPRDAVSRVSCRAFRTCPAPEEKKKVVAVDCGMKENIVRSLDRRGVSVTVVPWNTGAEEIRAMEPDGILISNGPGDPEDVPEVIRTVRELIGYRPVFGICLGHQIICLACGARTYKLKFGHHGGNHPVRELGTGRIEITSQNHSYAVDADSLEGTGLSVTHVNLLDHTVEGIKREGDGVFGVQYHPESAPGPRDSGHLFARFVELL